jgi:hypothetical protein
MILAMLVPLADGAGCPITLALRTLPRRPRGWLLAALHSRVAEVLSFPPLALTLFIVTPWVLYFSGWYAATLHHDYLHEMTHLNMVIVGCLFFWPLMGIDPLPGRISYPARMLLVVLTLPFHAFMGVTIMAQEKLIGGDGYPDLHTGPMGAWLPNPHTDQHLAGGIPEPGDAIGPVLRGPLRPVGSLVDGRGEARGSAARPPRGREARAAARPLLPRLLRRPVPLGAPTGRTTEGSLLPVSDSHAAAAADKRLRVLVYSDDVTVRQQVILALGRRPHADLPARVRRGRHRTRRPPEHGRRRHRPGDPRRRSRPGRRHGHRQAAQGRDLPVPPILVLIGRPQDAWLATWSRAEAAVPHPIDLVRLAEAVTTLLRPRVPAATAG